MKQHFFAIRKTIGDVEDLGQNNNDAIVTMDKEITVFMNNKYENVTNEEKNLEAYTDNMLFKELINLQGRQEESENWMVNIGFEKVMDNRTLIDFVPLIYQERSTQDSHHFIVFDVNSMKVVRHYSLLSNISIRKRIR